MSERETSIRHAMRIFLLAAGAMSVAEARRRRAN